MVTRKGEFVAVRLECLDFAVPLVAIECGENVFISQQVNALVHSLQRLCIPYNHRVRLSVVDTKTKLSVILQGERHRALPFQHCWLDHHFFERPVDTLTFLLFFLQPNPVRISKCWAGVWP